MGEEPIRVEETTLTIERSKSVRDLKEAGEVTALLLAMFLARSTEADGGFGRVEYEGDLGSGCGCQLRD